MPQYSFVHTNTKMTARQSRKSINQINSFFHAQKVSKMCMIISILEWLSIWFLCLLDLPIWGCIRVHKIFLNKGICIMKISCVVVCRTYKPQNANDICMLHFLYSLIVLVMNILWYLWPLFCSAHFERQRSKSSFGAMSRGLRAVVQ